MIAKTKRDKFLEHRDRKCDALVTELAVIRGTIKQLERKFELVAAQYHRLDKARRCKLVDGCSGFENHLGVHTL